MTATATKLPMSTRPLIQDLDLSKAVEQLLEPYEGNELEAAQDACRTVFNSNMQGTFGEIVGAYATAIERAVKPRKGGRSDARSD